MIKFVVGIDVDDNRYRGYGNSWEEAKKDLIHLLKEDGIYEKLKEVVE